MTDIKHDLGLRVMKVLDVALITASFAVCWYLYYAPRTYSPFPKVLDGIEAVSLSGVHSYERNIMKITKDRGPARSLTEKYTSMLYSSFQMEVAA